MQLIDAIKQKGDPYWIPDCSRDDLPHFFKELGFKVGVEVGVSWGENLEKYCQAGLTMYGVDPWMNYEDYQYGRWKRIDDIEDLYKYAVKYLSSYPNCTLIRKTSMEAANDFPKCSLDFVYIDGNHTFGYTAMDLMKWSDKVKRGGIIAGHDYYTRKSYRGTRLVPYVVDAFVKGYYINNWYILGRKEPVEGERIDHTLSYMFFKHW